MSDREIIHTFKENTCEIKVPIAENRPNVNSLDLFIYEYLFVFVSDNDKFIFRCPRKFNLEEMKNISICYNSKQWEYTCILPCHPEETNDVELSESVKIDFPKLICITELCVLSVDGQICAIENDFEYGFMGLYRGKPKLNEGDLSNICRVSDPSCMSAFKRIIQRENDEINDFSPEQYKLDFAELEVPEGYENPINYTIPYDDVDLTKEEECILEKIRSQHTIPINFSIKREEIHYGLVSILLGIMYDIRVTSNEPTCVSHWTRTILSPVLSYFEEFNKIDFVVESFLRRSLIYPLYRKFDLARLCVSDAAEGMKKGKSWILKQLLVTYKCFCEADPNRKALNKYFIRHYIWYVDTAMDDEHIRELSVELSNVLPSMSENNLRLGLSEIQCELLREILGDFHLTTDTKLPEIAESSESESEYESDSQSSSD